MKRTPTLLLALSAAALSACAGPTRASEGVSPVEIRDEHGWIQPSKSLAQRIELRASEAEFVASGEQYVELHDWFVGVGEPAYPTLLDMAASGISSTRQMGLAVIATLHDRRLLKPLKESVGAPPANAASARYAYGRALVAMGDLDGAPYLIEALRDAPAARTRKLAHNTLTAAFGSTGIPYDAYADEIAREAGADAWQQWYVRTKDSVQGGDIDLR